MWIFKKKFSAFLIVILLIFTLVSCEDAERVNEKDAILTMVTSGDNPPFEYHDTSHGKDEIVGMDIDLAHAIVKELGMNLEIKDMEFNNLIPSLQAGRADFVIALMTPSEERKKNISFSDPYYISRIAIVTPKNKSIEHKQDLAGKRIGVQLGSTNEQTLKEMATTVKNLQIISLNKLGELIQEIRAGRIDGVMLEAGPSKAYVEANDDLNYNILDELQSDFAIAFPKNSLWVDKFNSALKKLKAEGRLEKIMRKWFKE